MLKLALISLIFGLLFMTPRVYAESVSQSVLVSATVPVSNLWAKAMADKSNIVVLGKTQDTVTIQVQVIGLDNKPMQDQKILMDVSQNGLYQVTNITSSSGKAIFVYNLNGKGNINFSFTDITYKRQIKLDKEIEISAVRLIDSIPLS